MRTADGTFIQANVKYLDRVLTALGMTEAKPAPTPGVETHRDEAARTTSEELDEDTKQLYRSCVMCLLFYLHDREDAQFEISHLAGQVPKPVALDMAALKRLCGTVLDGSQGCPI